MGKTTNNLNSQLKNTKDIQKFLDCNETHFADRNFAEYLQKLLVEKGLKKSDVINRAGINPSYGYDIFSQGKNPSRDKLLALCFGFALTSDEANHLLNYASLCELYPRIRRDSIIIFALDTGKSIVDCNLLLDSSGEEIIQ